MNQKTNYGFWSSHPIEDPQGHWDAQEGTPADKKAGWVDIPLAPFEAAIAAGAVYAELPAPESYGTRNGRIDPKQPLFTEDDMRDHADRTHAIRVASHRQADPRWGVSHVAIRTSLTAKDGLDVQALKLEPLVAAPSHAVQQAPQVIRAINGIEYHLSADGNSYVHADNVPDGQAPAGATPEGWVTWWPSPSSKGHEPIYSHGPKQPGYGAELDAVLRKYPVFAAPAAPSTPALQIKVTRAMERAGLDEMERYGVDATPIGIFRAMLRAYAPLPAPPTIEGESNV